MGSGRVALFTDGSCWYKTEQGGYAFAVISESGQKLGEGHRNRLFNTTVNRMELRAIEAGLKWCNENGHKEVILFSDSEYSIKSITIWWRKWIDKPYSNPKNKQIILNILQEIVKLRNFDTQHVRGHQKDDSMGTYWNNYVDGLCRYNREPE